MSTTRGCAAAACAVRRTVRRPAMAAAPPPAAAVARHTVRHHTAETAARRLRNHGSPIPILMYHVLEAPAAGAPYPELYVRSSNFAAQMGWLAKNGYHAVTLRQAYD